MSRSNSPNLTEARSYAGTETFSDHRLVVMSYEDNWTKLFKIANMKTENTKRFNTKALINDPDMQKAYEERLKTRVDEEDIATWDTLCTTMKEVAEEVVGYVKPVKNREVNDNRVWELSRKQKDVRLSIMNEENHTTVKKLQKERKQIQNEIQKILT